MRCLFCNSSNIGKAAFPRPTQFNDKTFYYNECKDCGLVFINPIPSADDYSKMYASSYHEQFYFKNVIPDHTNWFHLLEQFSGQKKILDFGCGDASFLKFFRDKGYECTGVEYDLALVDKLKNENPDIQFYIVDDFWKQNEFYNIIFMGDVLEHLSAPSEFLRHLQTKLTSKGLIAAQGPLENNSNLALAVRKLFSALKGNKSLANHVPYHISFSNDKNQEMIFRQSGLQTKFYQVFETSWPFPAKFSASPMAAFQYFVAKISIILSRILPGTMGNRFIYIGERN